MGALPTNSDAGAGTGRDCAEIDARGGGRAPSEKEGQAKNGQEDGGGGTTKRHRRRTRKAPRANRGRGSTATSISATTPSSHEEKNSGPPGSGGGGGSSPYVGRDGGVSAAGSPDPGSGKQGRVKAQGRSPADESRTASGLSTELGTRTGARRGDGTETAGAVLPPSGGGASPAAVETGRRKSTNRGSHAARKESGADASQGGGGGGGGSGGAVNGIATVSLSTSVEVTVVDGMSMVEDGRSGSRQELTARKSAGGGLLPALKPQPQRGSMAKLARAAGVDEAGGENAEAGKALAGEWSSSMAESSVCIGLAEVLVMRNVKVTRVGCRAQAFVQWHRQQIGHPATLVAPIDAWQTTSFE